MHQAIKKLGSINKVPESVKKSSINKSFFQNEKRAYSIVESVFWHSGIVCPHCFSVNKSTKLRGKSTRIGVHKCRDCRKPFTVKIGTIFESGHIELRIWLKAIYLVQNTDISPRTLSEILGISDRSAARILRVWNDKKHLIIYRKLFRKIKHQK